MSQHIQPIKKNDQNVALRIGSLKYIILPTVLKPITKVITAKAGGYTKRSLYYNTFTDQQGAYDVFHEEYNVNI